MDIEEIKNQCENVKAEIERLTKEFEGLQDIVNKHKDGRVKRWVPEYNETFFYIDGSGFIFKTTRSNGPGSEGITKTYNCFKTDEEAEKEARRQRIEKQIRWIAWELNGGFHLDADSKYFLDVDRLKFFIYSSIVNNEIFLDSSWGNKNQGVTYCLSDQLFKVVKKELTDDDFKFYFGVSK